MLPAANRGAGMAMGMPDVCNTPAGPATVPVAYLNVSNNAQAVGFSVTVKESGVNALNIGSVVPMTNGDQAGVAHPTIMGQQQYTMGSPIVSIDRLPAITLTSPTTHNNMNCPAGIVSVPSAVNVFFCKKTRDDDPASDAAEAMAARSIDAIEKLPASVGYVRVRGCSPDLAGAFFDAVRRLDAEALVVDLRQNPGGDLDAALRLARELLPEGATVATLVEPDGEATVVKARGAAVTVPMVLVVDGGTASSAEVLTAALRGHRRALVVGERTFGKGKAWRIGPEGAQTAARCLGPDGRELAAIEPDLPGGAEPLRTAWAAAVHLASALGHRLQRPLR